MRAVANVDADLFRFRQRFDHRAQCGQDAIKRFGKTDSFPSRPGKPRCGMRFPLRGHAIAELGRSFVRKIHEAGNIQRPTLKRPTLNFEVAFWRFWGARAPFCADGLDVADSISSSCQDEQASGLCSPSKEARSSSSIFLPNDRREVFVSMKVVPCSPRSQLLSAHLRARGKCDR